MGAVLVVVDQEAPRGLADVVQPSKQVLIQDVFALGPVEALDVSVLIGFSRLDVLDGHAGALGPVDEGLAEELRSVIDPQDLRQRSFAADLIEAARRLMLDQPGQRRDQLGIAYGPVQRRRVPRRSREAHDLAGPAQRARVGFDQEAHGAAFVRRP